MKLSTPWKTIFIVVIAICVLVAMVIGGPLVFEGHLATVKSELNFTALLATLLGGIMAAAGLIVTLVSVVSFTTLERRIENKFNQLTEKNANDQRQKTNDMFQGFALQLQAISMSDLLQAESVLRKALEYYPDLPGSRRQMALRFFNATEAVYVSKLFNKQEYLRLQVNNGISAVLDHQLICQNFSIKPEGLYAVEAEKWLEEARTYNEDQDGFLAFCLAKLYGIRGRFQQMIELLNVSGAYLNDSQSSLGLIYSCAHACRNEEELVQLAQKINRDFPCDKNWIIEQFNLSQRPITSLGFLCKKKLQGFILNFEIPNVFKLRIHPLGEDRFQISIEGDQPHKVKWIPENNEDGGLSMDEAWTRIDALGWVLERI